MIQRLSTKSQSQSNSLLISIPRKTTKSNVLTFTPKWNPKVNDMVQLVCSKKKIGRIIWLDESSLFGDVVWNPAHKPELWSYKHRFNSIKDAKTQWLIAYEKWCDKWSVYPERYPINRLKKIDENLSLYKDYRGNQLSLL